MSTSESKSTAPWNKGKLVGQKLPLFLKEIWAIRVRLQLASNRRDLALFNLAIDSKLRGSDLVKMKISDISNAGVAQRGRWSYSRKQAGQFSSKSQSKRARQSVSG